METLHERYRWTRWLTNPLRREDLKIGGILADDVTVLAAHPGKMSVDGQWWTYATNGDAMVLVRGHIDWREASTSQAETLRGFITRPVAGETIDIREFKKWLGAGWADSLPCPKCDSDWVKHCTACNGAGSADSADCPDCGDSHVCKCLACDGCGAVYCARCTGGKPFTRRVGRIGDVVFDRCLAARFLAHVDVPENGEVFLMTSGPHSPIWIEPVQRNWRVVIMPMRDSATPDIPSWKEWQGA